MTDAEEQLAEAIRIHDDNPWAARALILSLPGQLPPTSQARLTWIAVHVLGGLLKRWPEALLVCRQAVSALEKPGGDMLARLAVAATLAGDALQAAEAEAGLASILACPAEDTAAYIRLAVIEQDLSKDKIEPWLLGLDRAITRAEAIEAPADLVRLLAITANNTASLILEWRPAATGETARALQRIASLSFYCWTVVGTWVHRERAHYLMALVSNATGRPVAAADHARQGLALIEANEPQPVDACFHYLALARALKATGDAGGSDTALTTAAAFKPELDAYWQGEYEKARAAV